MYTDTVQTFVILAGAFILTGYGMGLPRVGRTWVFAVMELSV